MEHHVYVYEYEQPRNIRITVVNTSEKEAQKDADKSAFNISNIVQHGKLIGIDPTCQR